MALKVSSEGPVKITKATVDAAWRRRAKDVRLVIRDAEARGLALVVNPTAMTWRYDYKPRGTDPRTGKRWASQTITIGNPSTHSIEDARAAANRSKGEAAAGKDPAAERRAAAEVARHKRAATLDRLIADYALELPTRPKLRGTGLPSARHTREEVCRVEAAAKAMDAGGKPVADIAATDIRKMLDVDAARPATARARYGALSRFFDWCLDAGHVQMNPCSMVARSRRPKTVQARAHYLSLPDLAGLWRAAEELPETVWRDMARFLIAVPCRRGEAAALDWLDLDLDAAEWRQAAGTTKNGEAHRLYLHTLALGILRARHDAAGKPRSGLVFPSPEAGRELTTFSAIKRALDSKAGLTGWRWHDFRRSFATALGEAGTSEAVADAVLNHKQAATRGGVLGVYQRAERWPEQVAAMTAWGKTLTAQLAPKGSPKPAGNIVRLPARRRRTAGG